MCTGSGEDVEPGDDSDDEYRAGQIGRKCGNYYTDKDNYYVLGSMGERWAGRGLNLGLQGSVDKDVFTRLLEEGCRTERI